MSDFTSLDQLLAGVGAADTQLRTMDNVPVGNVPQRLEALDTTYSRIGGTEAQTALAIGAHNEKVAQATADLAADHASKGAFEAVNLAGMLEDATEQVSALRTTAETANQQLQPMLEQRNALAANFPGWGNPLARVATAYKVAQLDERIAGLQQNAAAAVDAANSLASTQSAAINEYSQARQLRLNGEYNERKALMQQQFAGDAERLNAVAVATGALTREAQARERVTMEANTANLQGEELRLRKNEADRRNRAEDALNAQIDTLAKQFLRTKGVNTPSSDQLNGARALVNNISPEARSHLARLVTMPNAQVPDRKTILNGMATSGASLQTMREIGAVLGEAEIANFGQPLYTSSYNDAFATAKRAGFMQASEADKKNPNVRKIGGLTVTESQWWESLKPAERKVYEDQAVSAAKMAMQTNTIAGLNASVYAGIGPQNSFSITPKTVREVEYVFQLPANSPEAQVLLDPAVRVRFEAAAKQDPNNAGPSQFLVLHDAFKRAGVKDPAAAVSKVVSGFARGAASATKDGAWLREVGIDLPALYVVRDAHGNPRNLANPQDFEKFRLLTERARKTAQSDRGIAASGMDAARTWASQVVGFSMNPGNDTTEQPLFGDKPKEQAAGTAGSAASAGTAPAASARTASARPAPAMPEKRVQSAPAQPQDPRVGNPLYRDPVTDPKTDAVWRGDQRIEAAQYSEGIRKGLQRLDDTITEAGKFFSPPADGKPGESYGLRAVLEARARENALRLQEMRDADAAASAQSPDFSFRDFVRGDPAAREERIAAMGGVTGPADTVSLVGPSLADDIAAKMVQVQRAESSADKERGFLQIVRELYARAFGGGSAAYIPQTTTAQQQAEAAAEYERNGGR